jgi:hypothetical protein
LISASRPVSSVVIDPRINITFPHTRDLRYKELFEVASLTKNTPLEVGDIFESEKQRNTYIVMGQPCDLMVRSQGENAGKRANEQFVVPLVPFQRISLEEFKKKPINHWKTHATLEYYYPDSTDIAEVLFSKAIMVDVNVLDLSVLDPNGLCQINITDIPSVPNICTSGWKTHLETLINYYKQEHAKLSKLQKHIGRLKKQETKDLIHESAIALKAYSNGVFNFGFKRIGRYRRPGADRLLKAYTQYLSRDADDLDFARHS